MDVSIMEALIGDVVNEIIESADECSIKDKDPYTSGQIMGYVEALSSIKRAFSNSKYIAGMLEFDIDKRYLN